MEPITCFDHNYSNCGLRASKVSPQWKASNELYLRASWLACYLTNDCVAMGHDYVKKKPPKGGKV